MTVDHKPDVPEEKNRIEAAGRRVHDSRFVLTRCCAIPYSQALVNVPHSARLDGCLAVSRALGDLSLKVEVDGTSFVVVVLGGRVKCSPGMQ